LSACNEEGDGKGGKSNGNDNKEGNRDGGKSDGNATATRGMMVAMALGLCVSFCVPQKIRSDQKKVNASWSITRPRVSDR
jgi:hypothetical protein